MQESDFDAVVLDGLRKMEGKRVKVVARKSKELDAAEAGEAKAEGYYLINLIGRILSPAIRWYPENNPNGSLCLYLQTTDQLQTIYAIDLRNVEEVDDEYEAAAPKEVAVAGLTTPLV